MQQPASPAILAMAQSKRSREPEPGQRRECQLIIWQKPVSQSLSVSGKITKEDASNDEAGSAMAQDDRGNRKETSLSPELELAVLHLWSAALQMERNFSRQEIAAITGLSRTIEMARALPSAIGWDDVLMKPGQETA